MITCGTHSGYVQGCRCFECTFASRNYKRQRRGLPPVDLYELPVAPPPEEWEAKAACRGMNPDRFFPETGGNGVPEAVQVCHGCEVRRECLDFALEHRIDYGIWGGLSPRKRKLIRRKWREAS